VGLQRAEDPGDRMAAAGAIYPLLTAAARHQPGAISLAAAPATAGRTGPRRVTGLAVTEAVTQPPVTAPVTVPARAGPAGRRAGPRDQRAVPAALTAAGADYPRCRRRAGTQAPARPAGELPPGEAAALPAAAPALRHPREPGSEQRAAGRQGPAPAGEPIR
jgi:hypothetical protein